MRLEGTKRRRCDEPRTFQHQLPSVAPDSTRRPPRGLRARDLADTFPFSRLDVLRVLLHRPGTAPLLAVGEVLALGAAPRRVREEVLGLDREGDLANQPGGPGQVLERPGGLVPLEPGLGRLEQHVQPQARDLPLEEQEGQRGADFLLRHADRLTGRDVTLDEAWGRASELMALAHTMMEVLTTAETAANPAESSKVVPGDLLTDFRA